MTALFEPEPPYKICPKCNKEGYGVLVVKKHSYIRRCKYCHSPRGYERHEEFPLPSLNKKIVYLDQFAISEMAKAKENSLGMERWVSLREVLSKMLSNQLIVCPDSTYHDDETNLFHAMRNEIKKFYRYFSAGITFKTPHTIEARQVSQSLKKFIGEDKSNDYIFKWQDAFTGDPSRWHELYNIRANLRLDETGVNRHRDLKKRFVQTMTEHFTQLPKKEDFNFSKEVDVWNKAAAESLLSLWGEHIKQHIEVALRIKPFDSWVYLNASTVVDLVQYVFGFFKEQGVRGADLIRKMQSFFYSEYFYKTPYVKIGSLFSAGVSRRYVEGMRKKGATRGDFYDILMLSHLIPYCDAMLIDNEARAILTESPVSIEKHFAIKLFSCSNLDGFLIYLKGINDSALDILKEAVVDVYGKWHEV